MVFVVSPEPEGGCQDASAVVEEPQSWEVDTGWTERESASRSCMVEVERPEMVVQTLVQGQAETVAAGRTVVD